MIQPVPGSNLKTITHSQLDVQQQKQVKNAANSMPTFLKRLVPVHVIAVVSHIPTSGFRQSWPGTILGCASKFEALQ